MKHFITFLFMLLMVNFTIGQQDNLDYSGIKKLLNKKTEKPSSSKGTDEITGEITTTSFYAPGATTTLIFTIIIQSPDAEYGDSLAMTFPEGITPLDGSPYIGATGGLEELFNGVDGQLISWGDDDNDWGGITSGIPFEFWVDVLVDASVTGGQDISYFVSGDEYGAPPNAFTGIVTIYEAPDFPDLAPVIGYIAEYYSIPIQQATAAPEGSVINLGYELTEATDFNLTIGNDYDENMAITIPLGTGQTEDFTFPVFSPPELGTYTFTYTANASNDLNPDNGTFVKDIEISESVLSRNNGDIIGAESAYGLGHMFGNVFYVSSEDELTAISFYLESPTPGDIVSAAVYAFDEVPGELIASAVDVVITEPNTEYTALFPNPVSLPEGKYLFAIVEGEYGFSLAYTSTPDIAHTSWWSLFDNWLDLTVEGLPMNFVINGIFGEFVPFDFDISLEELTIPSSVLAGDVDISGTLRNLSGDNLTSIDIEYTIDGGDAVLETFSGLSVGPGETYDFIFASPANLTELGVYEIDVTISNANGAGPDINPDNDQLSTAVSIVDYIPSKMIVCEEATGTWCAWCVRGIVYMDSMAMKYPDTWIGIAVHNSDPMVVPEYDSGIQPWISGYPNGLVDRADAWNPLDFEEAYNERIDEIAPADVMIQNISVENGILTFEVAATFYAQVSNYRLNAALVEDYVTGTGADWNQANAYSGGGNGPMGGFEDLPNPVPAADMVYMDVARALFGGWEGAEGSLPETMNPGETHTYEFSITLDESWDVDNMEIVGMLIDQTTGNIENAGVDDVVTGIQSVIENSDVSIYPNPSSDKVSISTTENSAIYVYSMNGQLMIQKENISGVYPMDISELNNGTYIIKIVSDSKITTSKVSVIR